MTYECCYEICDHDYERIFTFTFLFKLNLYYIFKFIYYTGSANDVDSIEMFYKVEKFCFRDLFIDNFLPWIQNFLYMYLPVLSVVKLEKTISARLSLLCTH